MANLGITLLIAISSLFAGAAFVACSGSDAEPRPDAPVAHAPT